MRPKACLPGRKNCRARDVRTGRLGCTGPSRDAAERWRGSSYHAQEIEGIGGVLKVKHKKQMRIGECVKLYEDERDKAVQYLEREVTGKLRSWCSWCERIVLGEKDKADLAGLRMSSASSSSTLSASSE
jgi:hypothetical protein